MGGGVVGGPLALLFLSMVERRRVLRVSMDPEAPPGGRGSGLDIEMKGRVVAVEGSGLQRSGRRIEGNNLVFIPVNVDLPRGANTQLD